MKSKETIIVGLLSRICKEENIRICNVDEVDDFCGGCAFEVGGEKYILIDKYIQNYERQFVVAHEVAHHILGHIRKRSNTLPPRKKAKWRLIYLHLYLSHHYC